MGQSMRVGEREARKEYNFMKYAIHLQTSPTEHENEPRRHHISAHSTPTGRLLMEKFHHSDIGRVFVLALCE